MLAVSEKNLRQLSHDRRTLAMLVIMPLLIMILFGYVFSGQISNVHVAYVNFDSNDITRTFHSELLKNNTLSLQDVSNTTEAQSMVKDGRVWAAIIIPSNFTSTITTRNLTFTVINGSIITYIDGSNPAVATAVLQRISAALQNTVNQYFGQSPVKLDTHYVYGENITFLDSFAPAVIGLTAQVFTTILPLVSLVRERTTGTIERLMASPLTRSEIVLGYILSYTLIGLLQSSIILLVGVVIFNITIKGSLLLTFLLIYLFSIGTLGLGMLLSTVARNEIQALQFVPLTYIPAILLSGMLIPVESIPYPFNFFSYVIPLTYLIEILRSVMVRGIIPATATVDVAALTIFALVTIALGTLTFRREIK